MLTCVNLVKKMFTTIEGPANCDIQSEILFLNVWKAHCLTIFSIRKIVILVDFTPRNKTINAAAYGTTLKKQQHAFQN